MPLLDKDRLLEMEEAIETGKSICNADPSAVLFVLCPMEHASTDKVQVTKNRRNLEDTLMGRLVHIQSVSQATIAATTVSY